MPLIPIEWLKEHVAVLPGTGPQELAAALVKVGLEEEAIHRPEVQGPIVVGKVLTQDAKEQSNGKIINYCRVDVGRHNDAPGTGKEPAELASRGIICGAHNFTAGDYVVVSLPGAVLPGDFKIAARKTYGHISDGMICSVRELGIGEDHDGIIVLAHDAAEAAAKGVPAPGEDVLEYLGIQGEILEINITPDRGYCFSMRGVAREYAHSTGAKFSDPIFTSQAAKAVPEVNNAGFPIVVEDAAPIHGVSGCDRFITRIVRGVNTQAESPQWLQNRLIAAGMRPISLAVDATNYVMLDLGQPLHAYDLDTLTAPIVVRRANPGEQLHTLDGITRTLNTEDLLIADSQGGHGARAIGLAGTMGGLDTEITAQTTDILIEAAHFDTVSVARMARRHKLPSEAAKRFERGVDREVAPVAAQAVAEILVEYGGGTIDSANYEFALDPQLTVIDFNFAQTARLTGLTLDVQKQISVLREIGCDVTQVDDDRALVSVPSWRPDIVGSAHLVEEIARLIGYDQIPAVVPYAPAGHGLPLAQRQRRDISRALAEQGWVQTLSYPFISAATFEKQQIPATDVRRVAVKLQNPLQEDAPYLRTSVLDSLLETARLNVARGNEDVAIFEVGRVTLPTGIAPAVTPGTGKRPAAEEIAALNQAIPAQPYRIAGVACPQQQSGNFGYLAQNWDWRDAVQAAKTVLETIGLQAILENAEYAPYHPGRCAQVKVNDQVIGYAGELAPKVCKATQLPARSVAFELDLDLIHAVRGDQPIQVKPVVTFPVAKEDFAFVVDETVSARDLGAVIETAAGAVFESLQLFDVYTGEQVAEGKKSLAFALRMRAVEGTLSAAEVASVRKRIVKCAKKEFGAELRS
ncbi:phenylalanine--tRNA ligase subunit beta [Arcanobacterium hippocoleae]|uniref:phenylalanine--tRNA ligase subunit beta n=1 Tax=Arcanobacterium hippocoleae TaxID=149017 RepID=UPI003341ACEE